MRERGYPTGDRDERESMLSVDHSDIVDRYRTASQIEARSQAGTATTEDLRQAMQHYRTLFDALLGDSLATTGATAPRTATTTPSTSTTTAANATPGTPTDPDA
jgi:hypothetical protein